jgi:hypothetical protein
MESKKRITKRGYYLKAKELGYRGELKWIGSTRLEWKEVCEELERGKEPAQYSFDLQYLFDCYPIRKRLMKHLRIHDIYILEYTVRGIKHTCMQDEIGCGRLMKRWAQRGNLKIMQWAYEKGCKPDKESYEGAAESGRIDIMEWIHSKGVKPSYYLLECASMCGHVQIMRWLKDPQKGNVKWEKAKRMLYNAEKEEHKRVVDWLMKEGCETYDDAFYISLKKDNKKLNMWLRKKFKRRSIYEMKWALRTRNMQLMEELFYQTALQTPPWPHVTVDAVKSKDLEIVKWACGKYGMWMDTFIAAIEVGSIEILNYLHENGCTTHDCAHGYAARYENEHVTKWLLEKKKGECPMDEKAFNFVTGWGKRNLRAMKYLRRWECPWDTTAYEGAIYDGQHKQVLWLLKRGCPFDREKLRDVGNEKTWKWLERMGY